jgi:HEAT repeat protein/pSer/pThr/pTyr-binding forkhead associated (FHA) protein
MGRDPGGIRVRDNNALRQHAEIIRRDDDLFIRDLGGQNGTLLNESRVKGEAKLAFGDRVRIGETVFELVADKSDVENAVNAPEGSTAGTAPAPENAVLKAIRSLTPQARRAIGLAVFILLTGLVTAGMLLGRKSPDPAEGVQARADVPEVSPNPTARTGAGKKPGTVALGVARAAKNDEAGWFGILAGQLVAAMSSVEADEDEAAEDVDLGDIAARLLAEAGDTKGEKYVEPDVDDGDLEPAEEPEGDIDFELEKLAARAEKAEAEGGRAKPIVTASGQKVDADALLAPLPRTRRRRLTPKMRTPLTNADRADVASILKLLKTTNRTTRWSRGFTNRVATLERLARYDDPSVSRALMFLAKDRDARVRSALAEVLAAHDNIESMKILLILISQKDAIMGVSAATALASFTDEKTVEWLYTNALRRAAAGKARAAAAEALGRIGEERAIPYLLKALSDNNSETRAAAAIALGRFREKGAVEKLVRLLRSRDARTRVAALLAIGSIRDPAPAGDVIKRLKDKDPSVRSAAARALGSLRVAESVGPLVEALGKEPSRVKDDIIRALTLITALRYDDNMLAWKSFVKEAGDRLIVADLALAVSVLDEIEEGNVDYYGIATHSTRICFVVDISGSMSGKKLEDAKGELQKALNRFTIRHFFNMIFFSHTAQSWRTRLAQATGPVLARAKAYVYAQVSGGGTNIYDSVILALKDPLVDTVFLLSDGQSGSGTVTGNDAMRAGIQKTNVRGVVIHCIGIGSHDREFMAGLAKDNNGKYVVPEARVR